MAKLQDKFFNRIIEGPLEMDLSDKVVALEVSNVKSLSSEQCENLKCGDIVVKKDASGEHAYKVTFKSATGMCITYHDAYCVETQSYDKIDGVWTYNSEDKTPLPINGKLESDIEIDGDITLADDATISGDVEFIGDITFSGDINGESNPSVKPVYWHTIHFVRGSDDPASPAYSYDIAMGYCVIINNSATPLTLDDFTALLQTDGFCAVVINGSYGSASDFSNASAQLNTISKSETLGEFDAIIENRTTHQQTKIGLSITSIAISVFEDLGANKLN